jgi:hypothetical protein
VTDLFKKGLTWVLSRFHVEFSATRNGAIRWRSGPGRRPSFCRPDYGLMTGAFWPRPLRPG